MSVSVFISWSGELSRQLAEELRKWLPVTLQFVKPYFSLDDIEKGTKWFSEVTNELGATSIGLICMTPDNTERPWLLFEAGALSKDLDKSRVCPILFGLEPADIKGPLASFQATRFCKGDFARLVATINNSAGETKLDEKTLVNVFEKWWPDLEKAGEGILAARGHKIIASRRSDRDILEEILELVRRSSIIDRSEGKASLILASHDLEEQVARLRELFKENRANSS